MNWLVEITTTKSNRQFTIHRYVDDLFLTFDDLIPTTSIMFLVLSTQHTRKSSLQKKIKPTMKVSFAKNKKFSCAGGSAHQIPVPPAMAGGFAPRPSNILQLRISGYAPGVFIAVMLFCVNRFCGSVAFMIFQKRLFL